MLAFTAAFSLDTLGFSGDSWAKLPVAIALASTILLISWCVYTMMEAKAYISLSDGVPVFKDYIANLIRSLRSSASEPGSDAGDDGDDGQGMSGMLDRTVTLKEAFGRLRRRLGLQRASTLVNPTRSSRRSPSATAVEMGEVGR